MKIDKSVKIFFSLLLITVGFLGVVSAATLNVQPGESIQDAINAAQNGDTINVAAGNYNEQLTIDKSLTLVGTDAIINAPSVLTGGSDGEKAIITVKGFGVNTEISGFIISGTSSSDFGIFVRDGAYANIHNNVINSNNLISIMVGRKYFNTIGTATISDNLINAYQKGAITVDNLNSNAIISSNSIDGAGPTSSIAQNGIQISRGATGIIEKNAVVGNHFWTGTYGGTNDPITDPDADGAAGILLYHSGNVEILKNNLTTNQYGIWSVGADSINIHDNTVLGTTGSTGIAVWDSDMWTTELGFSPVGTSGMIINNIIKDNKYGLIVKDYTFGGVSPNVMVDYNLLINNAVYPLWTNIANTLNAQNNYWGTATPDSSLIIGNVDYTLWFNDEAMTQMNLGTPTITENETRITTASDLEFDVLTSLGAINVQMPNGITITGNDDWTGVLNAPSLSNSSVSIVPSSGTQIGLIGSTIEVGFPNISLTFNKAVRILIPGRAGQLAGYSVSGTDFTPITTTCVDNSQLTNDDLPVAGNCKLDVGNDLVIWTKHFTTFVTYTEAGIDSGGVYVSSSSGGGSGGASAVKPKVNTTTNTTELKTETENAPIENPTTSNGIFGGITGLVTDDETGKIKPEVSIVFGVIVVLGIGLSLFFKLKNKRRK